MYALLPFLSSAFYGLGYILLERILKSVNILTYTVCSSIVFSAFLVLAAIIKRDDFSFAFLSDKKLVLLFLGTVVINVAGWLVTLLALQKTSATYTAFAEISYPLFTLLFLFLFFGVKEINGQVILGGAFVLIGSVILVAAQGAKP